MTSSSFREKLNSVLVHDMYEYILLARAYHAGKLAVRFKLGVQLVRALVGLGAGCHVNRDRVPFHGHRHGRLQRQHQLFLQEPNVCRKMRKHE